MNFINKIKDFCKKLTKVQKILLISLFVFILVDVVLVCLIASGRKVASINLEYAQPNPTEKLIALNGAAHNGKIKKSGYANYKFSDEQKEQILKIYQENQNASVVVRLNVRPSKKQVEMLLSQNDFPLYVGFLYQSDLESKKKEFIDSERKLVKCNLYDAIQSGKQTFDISFAIPKLPKIEERMKTELPVGFFVYSSLECQILAAATLPSVIGFDKSAEVPLWAFASNGGIIDFSCQSVDFSGAPFVFSVENSKNQLMPQFVVGLSSQEEFQSTLEQIVTSQIVFESEKLSVKNVKNADELTIPSSALKTPFTKVEISKNPQCITRFLLKAIPSPELHDFGKDVVLNPVKIEPGLILKYKKDNWRHPDYEVFQWDRFPNILFFDTKDYGVQDRFFTRLAYFVEKAGYRGTLLTNHQLEGKHGYNAHDYSPESLANFFNKAYDLNFTLNKEEEDLKLILLYNGILLPDGQKVKAGQGGIVSLSQESAAWLRTTFLAHEGWHTLFFADEEFRNYVAAVYFTMEPKSLQFLSDYFNSQPGLSYSQDDLYLMQNEFMAYIMQQPLSNVASYFVHLANRLSVREATPELSAYIRNNNAIAFEDAAIMLNDFVFDKYGIVCGNIALIGR